MEKDFEPIISKFKQIQEEKMERISKLPKNIQEMILETQREKAKEEEEYQKKITKKEITDEDWKILHEQLLLIKERLQADE